MSVLTLDLPVFNYLRSGVETAAYRSVVDVWYLPTVRQYFQNKNIETESLRLVKSWATMNELSYCGKYQQGENSIAELIQPTFTHKPLEPLQYIKYIQCLVYNIELEQFEVTPQQTEDYQLLKSIQYDAMAAFVGSQKEYKDAAWCD